jgi:hypothetical protein
MLRPAPLVAPLAALLLASTILSSACGAPEPGVIEPKLSVLQVKVFKEGSCISCHVARGIFQELDLSTAAQSYAGLLGSPATGRPVTSRKWASSPYADMKLVVPGDPDNSALVKVLEQPADLPSALKMPSGAKLPQARIDAVRQWILEGALNN